MDKNDQAAVSEERLAELIEATDMRGRYEPADYCKRIDADTAAALRELQRLRDERRLAGREVELTGSCPSCGGKLNESREPMLYPCATLHYQDGSP